MQSWPALPSFPSQNFFWSAAYVGAEFTFKCHTFTINTDEWDGALWIITKDRLRHPDEMQFLRDAVEAAGEERGLLANLWRSLITETFT